MYMLKYIASIFPFSLTIRMSTRSAMRTAAPPPPVIGVFGEILGELGAGFCCCSDFGAQSVGIDVSARHGEPNQALGGDGVLERVVMLRLCGFFSFDVNLLPHRSSSHA